MVRLSDYVRPSKAAEIIGCTPGRVYQKLRDGDFRDVVELDDGSKLISRKECERERDNPADTGRPRKQPA